MVTSELLWFMLIHRKREISFLHPFTEYAYTQHYFTHSVQFVFNIVSPNYATWLFTNVNLKVSFPNNKPYSKLTLTKLQLKFPCKHAHFQHSRNPSLQPLEARHSALHESSALYPLAIKPLRLKISMSLSWQTSSFVYPTPRDNPTDRAHVHIQFGVQWSHVIRVAF